MLKSYLICKSFGDLVIAANFFDNFAEEEINIYISFHLKPLYDAMQMSHKNVIFVNFAGSTYPAYFNSKKSNLHDVYSSYMQIRKFISSELQNSILLCDINNWKNRLLFHGFNYSYILNGLSNIYLDYSRYFNTNSKLCGNNHIDIKSDVWIFPDSRDVSKSFRNSEMESLLFALRNMGFNPIVARHSSLRVDGIVEYNDFPKLINIVKNASLIISADSLPAHLAEFYSKKIIVGARIPNEYWLPYSSFQGGNFFNLNNIKSLESVIKRL